MILHDLNLFEKYIPTAAGSDLEDLRPYLEEADDWLRYDIFGTDLYAYLEAKSKEDLPEVKAAMLVVCLYAYSSAIPFLDVIQTENGFAIISNTNVVPASKERVDRLVAQVEKRLSSALDTLITIVLRTEDLLTLWKKQDFLFLRHSEIVFLTTRELSYHSVNKVATYKDLYSSHSHILSLQVELEKYVSADYLKELLVKRAGGTLSDPDKKIFPQLQVIIGLYLQKRDPYKVIEKVVNLMVSNPDDYPAYIASEEYRLKISGKYENKRQDPTFFFGG